MKNYLSRTIRILMSVVIAGITLASCEEKEKAGKPYENGAFLVNEGTFGNNNGTVSFYDFETDSVYNDIFYQVNNRLLGDVLQSLAIYDGKAYIVVNNSNKVEVTDAQTFAELGVIENVNSPRYFVADGTRGFLSCWGDNTVKVIDLATNLIDTSIAVASGPEKMCIANGKLYVANTGGWSTDSVISVIDLTTQEVIKSIEVGYAPYDLVVDPDQNIWVLCFGRVIYNSEYTVIIREDPSTVVKINTADDSVIEEQVLFNDEHPMQLEISSDGNLFFGGGYAFGGIFRFNISDHTFSKIIDDFAYGMNIDPETDEIYITITPDYTSAGSIKRFTSEGNLLGTYACGISPNSVIFR
jgi:YVTN family beta-propeller protein